MKAVSYITWRARVGLLLGLILAVYCTGFLVPFALAQPVAPEADRKNREPRLPQERPPLPAAGETPAFRYAQDQGDMYRIMPTDGSQSYLVPASYLQAILNNSQMSNSHQAELLRAHESLQQEMFKARYPDGTVQYETAFETQSFTSTDGTRVVLAQDPVAGPYVRVSITGGSGQPEEFSMPRAMAERLLANKRMTNDQRLEALRSFPFRLPEAARAGDFSRVSAAELARLVPQKPLLPPNQLARTAPPSAATLRQGDAPPGVPRSPDLAQRPQVPALGTGEAGSSRPSRAEEVDAHSVPASVWGRPSTYIVALSLLVVGLIAVVIRAYRR